MIISTTKFKLRKASLYGRLFIDTYRVVKQIRAAGGIVHMRIDPFSLRTITVWKTREEMLNFRNAGAHLLAMKKSRSYGAISSITWESDDIPSWGEAAVKLQCADETKHCSGPV